MVRIIETLSEEKAKQLMVLSLKCSYTYERNICSTLERERESLSNKELNNEKDKVRCFLASLRV